MFCKNCGNEVENGALFCKSCGTPVETVTPVVAGAPKTMTGMKIGLIIASFLLALSAVLPFFNIDKTIAHFIGMDSISLLKPGDDIGDGIFYILFAVVAIVFVCLNKKIPVLICGILSAVLCCYEVLLFKNYFSEISDNYGLNLENYIAKGIGYYLLIFSVILLLVLGIINLISGKKGAN